MANNNNKFFILQVLRSKTDQDCCYTWIRWGRVGLKGQSSFHECNDDIEMAKKIFTDKFADKTQNQFSDRKKFKKVNGKYDLLHVDYSKRNNVKTTENPTSPAVDSKLDVKVKKLLEMICDVKKMEEAAKNMKYDINKNPLGDLTKAQIKAGYEALTKIENAILSKKFDKDFEDAVNAYYTRIPHYFG